MYYAAGDTARAHELFTLAAEDGHHLGWENLSVLALEADRPLEALHYLRRAAQLQPSQSFGRPNDQALFNRITRAEYLNTMAVIYHRLGWDSAAVGAARAAVAADPTLPEAAYDLAVLTLADALSRPGKPDAAWRAAYVHQSRSLLWNAVASDPGFHEARTLMGAVLAHGGDCADAAATVEHAVSPAAPASHRLYPVDTGLGDLMASAVRRRRHITELPAILDADHWLAPCRRTSRHEGSRDDDA